MIVLHRTKNQFGRIDGSRLLPDLLGTLSVAELSCLQLNTDRGLVSLDQVFEVHSLDSSSINQDSSVLLLIGDCALVDGLATGMQQGTLCVLGSVGDFAGKGMKGGELVISSDARNHLASGLRDGFVFVGGNCGDQLASPLPGKRTGMRGGDVFVGGNAGVRACERLRRGTVFIGGNAGDYAASQLIAGTLVVLGEIGDHWGGGMRRGSLILGRDFAKSATASLSGPSDFELSFLPLIWRHVEQLQARAQAVLLDASGAQSRTCPGEAMPLPSLLRIPHTRWVQRQIADLNYQGRGEVLVLRRTTSPGAI
jgi:formylmethanofuran dehydrogenase subunit C